MRFYNVIIKLLETGLNIMILSILNLKYFWHKENLSLAKHERIHILGNGPSLKDDYDDLVGERQNSHIIAVNGFAESVKYAQLTPDYYLIVDSGIFQETENTRIQAFQHSVASAIVSKTTWEMTLLLPMSARNSFFVSLFAGAGPNLMINYFKDIPFIGGLSFVNHFLFKLKVANPLYENVLIAGISLALKMKYRSIFIWGADHSWHENLYLDDDNVLYRKDVHFNDPSRDGKTWKLIEEDGSPVRLHREFRNIARVFKTYHFLNEFANRSGVNIVNRSRKSWIDAFVKIKRI